MSEADKETEQKQQEQRTFLRERFLRMLGAMNGLQANVSLVDGKQVSCQLMGGDVDFEQLQVSSLSTPIGVVPHATLRTSDIVSVHVAQVSVKKSSHTT